MKAIKFLLLGLLVMAMAVAWAPLAAPSVPVLISPINNAVLSVDPAVSTVVLKWYKSTPNSGKTISYYDIQVSDRSDFVAPFLYTNAAPIPAAASPYHVIPAGTLNDSTTYYWRVRAYQTAPLTGSTWSVRGTFRIGLPAPVTLTFNDDPDFTLRPVITWTLVAGSPAPQSFTIQYSVDCGFAAVSTVTRTVSASVIPANTYTLPGDLSRNMAYCARIRSNSSYYGNSPWYMPYNVPDDISPGQPAYQPASDKYIATYPPSTPLLASPASGAVVNDGTPRLAWQKSTVMLDAAPTEFFTYQIAIYDTKPISTTIPINTFCVDLTIVAPYTVDCTVGVPELGDITTTWMDIPVAQQLTEATTYYWRMRSVRKVGADYQHSSWSSLYTLKIGIVGTVDAATMNPSETYGIVPGLTDPALHTPSKNIPGYLGALGDNVRLLTLRPRFSWNPGALNAQSFHIQVAGAPATATTNSACNIAEPEKSSFSPLVLNVTGISFATSQYVPRTELPPNYVMCWRIRPYSAAFGYGQWSAVQIFLTANPPTRPAQVFGPVALTYDNSPRLSWTQSLPSRVDPGGFTTFGKYEVEITIAPNGFNSYAYPASTLPPFPEPIVPADYPLPAIFLPDPLTPILHDHTVVPAVGDPRILPIRPTTIVDPKCRLYPSMDQAHDTDPASLTYEVGNDYNEPWYQLHEKFAPALPGAVPDYGPLCGGRTYYWHVRGVNSNGEYSDWSPTGIVSIVVDRPENLTVITDPAIDSRASVIRPIFKWSASYHAERYIIQFAIPNTSYYYKLQIFGTEYQAGANLIPFGKVVYFYVTAIDGHQLYGTSLRAGINFSLP